MKSPPPARYVVLDFARFVAAAGIVVYHYENHFQPFLGAKAGLLESFHLFVDFFFVLSGFVMMKTYGHTLVSWQAFAVFLQKRLARIYPLHLAVTLAFVAGGLLIARLHLPMRHPETFDLSLTLPNLLLVQAWGTVDHAGLNFPSWSISSELFVYLLYPVFALALLRLKPWPSLMLAAALALALQLAASTFGLRPWTDWTFDFGHFRAVPSFFAGMAISMLASRPSPRRVGWLLPCGLAALIVAMMLVRAPDLAIIALFPALIFLMARAEAFAPPAQNTRRIFEKLGDVSFGIYMLHSLVAIAVVALVRASGLTSLPWLALFTVLGTAATLAIALPVYSRFEMPARRLLSRSLAHRQAVPSERSQLAGE